jgi:hypothetical protein
MISHSFAALTREISCSTLEINLVFPRTHVLFSIYPSEEENRTRNRSKSCKCKQALKIVLIKHFPRALKHFPKKIWPTLQLGSILCHTIYHQDESVGHKEAHCVQWCHRHTRQGGGAGQLPPPPQFWKTMEIRANDRKNQKHMGRFIRKYIKFRLFQYNPP